MLVLSPRWLWCAETGLREGAHLVIAGDRIADIVSERPSLDAERIELPDGLLTPGLINLHNHAFSAPLFRGLADDIQPGDLPGHIPFSLLMPLCDLVSEIMPADASFDFVMRPHAERHEGPDGLASIGFGPHGPDSNAPALPRRGCGGRHPARPCRQRGRPGGGRARGLRMKRRTLLAAGLAERMLQPGTPFNARQDLLPVTRIADAAVLCVANAEVARWRELVRLSGARVN